MTISLRIVPNDDETLVREGKALMTFLSDGESEETIEEGNSIHRDGSWVSIVALVLSLPATAVAISQILEKMSSARDRRTMRNRIEPTISAARERSAENGSMILTLGDRTVDLGNTTTDEVMDALAELEKAEGRHQT